MVSFRVRVRARVRVNTKPNPNYPLTLTLKLTTRFQSFLGNLILEYPVESQPWS